jgi:pimeloyl-ACP methyl ester carboxylesterase
MFSCEVRNEPMVGRQRRRLMGRPFLVSVLILVGLVPMACGGEDSPAPDQRGSQPTSEAKSDPTPEATGGATAERRNPKSTASYTKVRFTAEDGVRRSGRLFGDGDVGVVLSHMGRPEDGQGDWLPFAEQLANNGFRVLTYRGRDSLSESWRDVLGAVDRLRADGAKTVIAAGASIGAMASLNAAIQADSRINAVVWLAGVLSDSGYDFQRRDVSGLACPILIASGDRDSYGAYIDARRLHRWTANASELHLVDSDLHGTDILTADDRDVAGELRRLMIGFMEAVADRTPAAC